MQRSICVDETGTAERQGLACLYMNDGEGGQRGDDAQRLAVALEAVATDRIQRQRLPLWPQAIEMAGQARLERAG